MIAALLGVVVLASGQPRAVAQHDVTMADDHVVVRTRWSDASVADADGVIELATPLPAAAQIEGAEPMVDAAVGITALQLHDVRGDRATVRVVVALDEVQQTGALPLPVATRSVMQRVAVDDTLMFRPDPALELAVNLGFTMPLGMRMRERAAFDDALGLSGRGLGAVYVGTASIERTGGVLGVIETRAVGRRRAAIAAGVVFVALGGAGAWAYRRARRSAEAEHAELLLASEIDALDDAVPRRHVDT